MHTKNVTNSANYLTHPRFESSARINSMTNAGSRVLISGVRSLHKMWAGAIVDTIVTGSQNISSAIPREETRDALKTPTACNWFDAIPILDYLEFGLFSQNFLSRERTPMGFAAEQVSASGAYLVNTPVSFLPDEAVRHYDCIIHVTQHPFPFIAAALDWEHLGRQEDDVLTIPPLEKDVRRWATRWMVANLAIHAKEWPVPVLTISAESLQGNLEHEIGRMQTFLGGVPTCDAFGLTARKIFGTDYLTDLVTGYYDKSLNKTLRDVVTDMFGETIDRFYTRDRQPTERLLSAKKVDASVVALYEHHRPQQIHTPSILRNSINRQEKHTSVAYIPARSGSTRLKDKNIMDLGGKPLLAHSIEQAKKVDGISLVIVDTDSQEYADIARKFGAKVLYMRPHSLSTATSSIQATINHCIDALVKAGTILDKFIILYPTSPFRNSRTLQELYDLLDDYSRVSTCYNINLDFNRLLAGEKDKPKRVRSTSQEKLEQYSFVKRSGYFVGRNFLNQTMEHMLYEIDDPIECIDIDTDEDIQLAQYVLDNGLHNYKE